MYHNKDNSSGDPSEEEICVLPCQKIFMMSEGVKNILNDILSETNFTLENFDELDIESFQLKDKEKKNEKEFLIVEKSAIKNLSKIKEEFDNFEEYNIFSDINDISCIKKRKRDEPKKNKEKKKIRKNNIDDKLNKKYRNGDADGHRNFYNYLNNKNRHNINKCYGCCFCIKKKKLNEKCWENGEDQKLNCEYDNNGGVSLLNNELEINQEEIMYPKLVNPFENINSETITKEDFNIFFDQLTIYFSDLTSVMNKKFRQIDEKKSNKKKYIYNIGTERKSRKNQKLTDFDKTEIAKKIHELNLKQLNDMVQIFPKYVSKKDEAITFNFNDLPNKILWQLKDYVEKCYDDNIKNPIHQNYLKEIQIKSQLKLQETSLNQSDVIMSNKDANYLKNLNLIKAKNNLLSDKDSDISDSLSSSHSSSIDSISEIDRRIRKNLGNANRCFSPDYITTGNTNNGFFQMDDDNKVDESDSGYNKCGSESS